MCNPSSAWKLFIQSYRTFSCLRISPFHPNVTFTEINFFRLLWLNLSLRECYPLPSPPKAQIPLFSIFAPAWFSRSLVTIFITFVWFLVICLVLFLPVHVFVPLSEYTWTHGRWGVHPMHPWKPEKVVRSPALPFHTLIWCRVSPNKHSNLTFSVRLEASKPQKPSYLCSLWSLGLQATVQMPNNLCGYWAPTPVLKIMKQESSTMEPPLHPHLSFLIFSFAPSFFLSNDNDKEIPYYLGKPTWPFNQLNASSSQSKCREILV